MSQGNPNESEGTPPVAIACATVDQETVAEAAASLRERGHVVRVVAGAERDPAAFGQAIDELGGQGLYVLCRSKDLDREQIDALREVLNHKAIPFGRTLTLALEPKKPRALEERIVSVLRRMATGREPPATARRTTMMGAPLPGKPGVPPVRTVPPAIPGPAPMPPRGRPTPVPMAIPKPVVAAPPAEPALVVPAALPVAAPVEAVAPAPTPVPAVGSDEVDQWADSLVRKMPTAPAPVEGEPAANLELVPHDAAPQLVERSPSNLAARGQTARTPAVPLEQTFDADMDVDLGSVPRRGPNKLALGGLVVGALGLLTIVIAVSGDDEEPAKDTVAKADGKDVTPARTVETKSEAKSEAKSDAKAEAKAPPEDAAVPSDPEVPDESAPVGAMAEDSAEVVAALRDRQVRAFDVLLVPVDPGEAGNHAKAAAYCGALTIAGVTGWRLPDVGELLSLARGKMMPKGAYWSDTKGDTFGDMRLLVVTKKKIELAPVPLAFVGAKPLCVRNRG